MEIPFLIDIVIEIPKDVIINHERNLPVFIPRSQKVDGIEIQG